MKQNINAFKCLMRESQILNKCKFQSLNFILKSRVRKEKQKKKSVLLIIIIRALHLSEYNLKQYV